MAGRYDRLPLLGELPAPARDYVERLEELAGVPISHVSIGPNATR